MSSRRSRSSTLRSSLAVPSGAFLLHFKELFRAFKELLMSSLGVLRPCNDSGSRAFQRSRPLEGFFKGAFQRGFEAIYEEPDFQETS